MFDRYFCPRVTSRLRASPDADWLSSFLEDLDKRGYARLTIQAYLRQAELFGRWLRRRRRVLAKVTQSNVHAFAARHGKSAIPANAIPSANALLRHLRSRCLIPSCLVPASTQLDQTVTEYDAYLRDVAGLSDATRLYRRRYAHAFLVSVFRTGPIRWNRIQLQHARQFITVYGRSGHVAAAKVAACSLRSFFRWLEFQGHIGPELSGALPRFPLWRLAPLPSILSDTQVDDVLRAFPLSTATGRRNYAMALCMIDLGMMVAEVAGLTLSDVDTSAATLRVTADKCRRDRVLPMPLRVQRAVINYLHQGRISIHHHLFVRHRPPVGEPVSRELIRGVIRRAFARIAGCERMTGTHILRHTIASRLLRTGADLKRIADVLGHHSVDTAAIYAKVDLAQLSTVAMRWPTAKEVK